MTDVDHAYEECRRITESSSSSFYAGMRLLAPDRRPAIFAVYALARRIDDIADGTLRAPEKLRRLDRLRTELEAIDRAADPVLVAVADAGRRFPIPVDAFFDLLDGAASDVWGARYQTFDDLVVYCRRVAGSIGRLSLGVFDVRDRRAAEPLADDLGVALQLGNVLRDVAEDLRRGRCYLPADDLGRFGCTVHTGSIDGPADLLIAFEAERASAWLERGLRLVPLLDRRSALCVLGMTAGYARLIARIAREPSRALEERVSLSAWEKRLVLARGLAGSLA
jgi:15-cis-phytoene synthase